MKILIVTGKLAGELVIKASSTKKHEVHVHIADIPIAAFLTPNRIINEIKKIDDSITSELDLVLIPGLIPRDASIITKETGIPAYKGPTDAADLPIVLDLLDKLKLSPKKAADKLIEEEQQKRALKFIKDFEEDEEKREKLLKKEENILVGELPVGRDFPMRVLSEVAKAPFLKKEELIKQVNYLVKNGADIIDIRTIPGENLSKQIPEIIKTVKRVVGNLPVSIDTLNPDEIKAAVKAGAELVLSLDHGNYKEVLPLLEEKNIPAVILPTDYTKGWIPETVKERVESLESLKRKCRGIDVIPDPILDPVNSKSIVDSIKACKEYTSRNPEPIFFGAGNVAELIDVDSTGVNALLAGMGMELGAGILFTPEVSGKNRGSTYELAVASRMMFLAKNRKSIPKNLGIDLILFKDKRKHEKIKEKIEVPIIEAQGGIKFTQDKAGSFKILVEDGKIKVIHYKNMEPQIALVSDNAKKLYEEIIKKNLVTRLEHAAYLGAELQKAEIALITGKDYKQDLELFRKPFKL
ncbi:MAG TPA: dihydropteroate synthase-like protein [Methanobacteriales archaeon]|nr:MAG: hypothetical protein XD44_1509 [Methanobacteriaceae archaeon 41_258]MBC7097209.1 dihydropteroate synthase-like protein [Methanobacteriales archaeon]HIH62158.1 dihydropteroate synthase-like protein [Methanobacteriales archaeon]